MALIPADTVEAIRSRTDIAELVAEYVPQLQRAGRNLKARCPFHQERTPSFIVNPERQTFHCFGCGEGGDAFAFVMKIESLGFGEAAEKLAQRAGVRIETQEALGPEQRERLRLKEILAWAASFYHEALKKSPAAERARRYLAERKVSAASVAEFELGFAPGGSQLLEAARRKGYERDALAKAGLAAAARAGGWRDYFYERLMFPIRDARAPSWASAPGRWATASPSTSTRRTTPYFPRGACSTGSRRAWPPPARSAACS